MPATTVLIDYARTLVVPTVYTMIGAALMFIGIFVSTWHKSEALKAESVIYSSDIPREDSSKDSPEKTE